MKPEQQTSDATLQPKKGVERSVNLVFIGLMVLVLLSLEIFAMNRVQVRSTTPPNSQEFEPAEIREFEDIDFNFAQGYEEDEN